MVECEFNRELLYQPGMNRRRPTLPAKTRSAVRRRFGYACAKCRTPGVELHHIAPWREAYFEFGDPHWPGNLIALCPSCHAMADDGRLTRDELVDLVMDVRDAATLGWWPSDIVGPDVFSAWIQERHRQLIYRGYRAQFTEMLSAMRLRLEVEGGLRSSEGVAVLATLGGALRRGSSAHFVEARQALLLARFIAANLRKSDWSGPHLGRIDYDLGYIAYLENDFVTATHYFDRGQLADARSGLVVGRRMTGALARLTAARAGGPPDHTGLSEDLAAFRDSGDPNARRWVANSLKHLAEFSLWSGRPGAALRHLDQAKRALASLSVPTGEATLLFRMGEAFFQLHDLDRALPALSSALSYQERFHQQQHYAAVCAVYGRALIAAGEYKIARSVLARGASADPGMDNAEGIAGCVKLLRLIGEHRAA